MSDKENGTLARELRYYKREVTELGIRLHRLQNEQTVLFRDLRQSRLTLSFLREVSRLSDECDSLASLAERTVQSAVGLFSYDVAVVLRHRKRGEPLFDVVAAGSVNKFNPEAELRLTTPPAFLRCGEPYSRDENDLAIRSFLEASSALWSFDEHSRIAIALGNRTPDVSNMTSQSDLPVVEMALSMFLDASARIERGRRALIGPGNQVIAASDEASLTERDMHEHFERGGKILGGIVIERLIERDFVLLLLLSHDEGYRHLQTYRSGESRSWKDVTRLFVYVRKECQYNGSLTVLPSTSPMLGTMFASEDEQVSG